MKNIILVIIVCFASYYVANGQKKTTFENLNDAAKNVIDILNVKKTDNKDEVSKKTVSDNQNETFSNPNKRKICGEFCIENKSKIVSKVSIEFKETNEKQQLIIMGTDKSCIFNVPLGIYTIRVYQEEQLVKKSDLKLDDTEQHLYILPE